MPNGAGAGVTGITGRADIANLITITEQLAAWLQYNLTAVPYYTQHRLSTMI